MLHRLLQREIGYDNNNPNTRVHRAREMAVLVGPAVHYPDIRMPPIVVKKFTPDGQYLICFGENERDLYIYRLRSLSPYSTSRNTHSHNTASVAFDDFFDMVYRKTMIIGIEKLSSGFCIVTSDNKYVILALTAENNTPVPDLPVWDSTSVFKHSTYTFRSVELSSGLVVDERVFEHDCFHLAQNSCASVYDNQFLLVSSRKQTLFMFNISENGRFEHKCTILFSGNRIPGDIYINERLTMNENIAHSIRTNGIAQMPDSSNLPMEISQILHHVDNIDSMVVDEDDRDEHKHEDDTDTEYNPTRALVRNVESNLVMFEGLRLRILEHLYFQACNMGPEHEQRFYSWFDWYAGLILWKVRYLDSTHLFIKIGCTNLLKSNIEQSHTPPSSSSSSSSSSSNIMLFVVYNIPDARVLQIYHSNDNAVIQLFDHHYETFSAKPFDTAAAAASDAWTCASHTRSEKTRFDQRRHYFATNDLASTSTKILTELANVLFPNSQTTTASPYVDAKLCTYDNSRIGPCENNTYTALSHPLKFVDPKTNNVLFRFEHPPISNRIGVYKTMSYVFHPVLPLVIAVLDTKLNHISRTVDSTVGIYSRCEL